jgi:apolipoprotein N-acyltransferase
VRPLPKALIAAASGCLVFLSVATFDIWPLAWIALVPLLFVVLGERTERPALYGWLFGFVTNIGGFYWISPFLRRFGHLPLWLALPLCLLLSAYQGLTFALFAWTLRRLRERIDLGVTFLAPVVFVACELVVPYIFPWYMAISQAWVPAVIQVADLTGPLGVTFLIVLVNGALYDLVRAWRKKEKLPRRRLGAALAVMALALGYGQLRIHQVKARRAAAPKLKVGVVQANIGIHEKWRANLAQSQLRLHQQLSAELGRRGAELIVWPESSYPYLFRRDMSADWPPGHPSRARVGFDQPLLLGSLTLGPESRYPFNSALLLDKEGLVRGRFDKNILMVFGEYIPYYEQLRFLRKWIPEMSNWSRGTDVEVFPLELPGGGVANVGPMICYEDIFPSFTRRLAAKEPNLLVNITNDAWFGRTSEPYEHFALAVFRAVELRLDLVRAVNTGVSGFVDATGRVYQMGPSVDPGETPNAPPVTLLDEVAILPVSTIYATLGEWFGGLCLILTLLFAARARARAGRAVDWSLVGRGAGWLSLVLAVLSLVVVGPDGLGTAFKLLLHRPLPPGSDDLAFAVGVRMLPGAILGCLAAGIAVAQRAKRARPVETALAVLAVLTAPALVFGRLEGETAALIFHAVGGILLARLAARLTLRRRKSAPAQPPESIAASRRR